MLLLPKQRRVLRVSNVSGRPASVEGTALTSDGTTNVEPATPTELISAANNTVDSDWVRIWFASNFLTATDSDSLVNIKVGAAGSEVNLIPNLLAGWVGPAEGQRRCYEFPLRIPSGTRISATHRSVRTSTTVTCAIELLGGGEGYHWTGTGVECVGADTANSTGTYVTAGGVSEGSFTSIGTNTYEWGHITPMMAGNVDTTMNGGVVALDIGSGASTLIDGLEEFKFVMLSDERSHPVLGMQWRFCKMPSGTTLYLRGQHSANGEGIACCLYGVF